MTANTRDAKGGASTGDIAAGPPAHSSQDLVALCFGALGIVFGDIGTSPLYALRECFAGEHGVELSPANVLGVLSLIFWSLVLVICAKYLMFILRADNRGEGGILALMALVRSGHSSAERGAGGLVLIGLFGAALLYGDGMITPAISVLSAVEGLQVATTAFDRNVVPITVVILVALFFFQSRGTERIGAVFGPDHPGLVRRPRRARHRRYRPRTRTCCAPSTRCTRSASSRAPAARAFSSSARSSSSSPAARRSTPTWATSAGVRSDSPGSPSSCRPCC